MAECSNCGSDRLDLTTTDPINKVFCHDCGAYQAELSPDDLSKPTGSPIPPRHDAAELARLERTSAEHHARLAMLLWEGADAFGHVVAAVETMGNEGYQAIADEADAADKVVIEGPEIIRALRALAMRLDRAVMVKATAGD